jgi:hypothetical protein
MDAFRSRMPAVRARKEQEAAAQAMEEARAALPRDSDDDTAPQNEFDDILNEVCEETGYESEESDKEAWRASSIGLEAGPGINTGECT